MSFGSGTQGATATANVAADATYQYFRGEPLYPFGHGLSYTTFGYSDLSVRAEPGDRRLRLRWRWTRPPAFL